MTLDQLKSLLPLYEKELAELEASITKNLERERLQPVRKRLREFESLSVEYQRLQAIVQKLEAQREANGEANDIELAPISPAKPSEKEWNVGEGATLNSD